MQDWVKAYGDDNDKKELKKFNKESASHASYIARYIEDTLIRNDDLINQYWKYDETDNIEGDILTKIFDGDEYNYKEKLNELNQENKSNTKLNKQTNDEILFISLNKDGESLKSKYYDFYIQRLIRNIRSDNSYSRSSVE
jgi:ABC-type ATPase with predicted acetyltransferase domain